MHYSRRISWNRGSEKSLALQILQHTNNKKRNNRELLVVADVFRLLRICLFSNLCFLFHCLYLFIFPVYAQEFSLCNFFHSTSLRVVMGQRFFIPVIGESFFIENGRDDDRINNYAFI